jgi:FKBP-type peptidyl-prolyl cis-trans isomerase 2
MASINWSTRAQDAASEIPPPRDWRETMTQVKTGDTVHIHYTGTLNDGTTFDSSEGREPLTFEVGSGQIIPGLDSAIPGMAVGDKKTVNVACDDAYGQMNPAMRQDVPRADIPAEIPLEVGSRLQMQTQDGQVIPVTVAAVEAESVTLDANHPLAGEDLTFNIELVKIGEAA